MEALAIKAEELKPGTFFVTFTKKLPGLSENWELRAGFRRLMSWGIATIYILSPKKNGFIRTGLSYLGRKSFDIYVIHQSVLFGFNQNFLKVTSKVIISISMSLGLSKFLKQFSFLKIILFGKRKI